MRSTMVVLRRISRAKAEEPLTTKCEKRVQHPMGTVGASVPVKMLDFELPTGCRRISVSDG